MAAGWNDLMNGYAQAQRAAGRSPGTIRLHRHYLRRLATVCPSPDRVGLADLVAFLAHDEWAPETRKSARAALVGFYRWVHGAGHMDHDPAEALPAIRVPASVPRPAPEHLVARLVRDDGRVGFMAMLAAYGGLRAGEIARVHSRDYAAGYLLVVGKGRRVREVPVTVPRLVERLEEVEGWAFPNGHGSHLTPGHVTRLLSRALPEGWTAHTLRHRMATVAYAGTGDLLALGRVLGHSRPETTQRYVRVDAERVAAIARAAGVVA